MGITIGKWILPAVIFLAAGCAVQTTEVRSPGFDAQMEPPSPYYSTGSIWQANSSGMADDFKARRRGDLLTIVVNEQASASKEAQTSTGRESKMAAGIPNLLGLEARVPTVAPNVFEGWLKDLNLDKLVSASSSSSFDGSGSTSRKENLSATITVKVVDVLPNGNLLIEGRRNVKVNSEEQIMVLEGTVRPRDISTDNTISSAMVADARITYSGSGVVSDRQRPGWMLSILDKVWPF